MTSPKPRGLRSRINAEGARVWYVYCSISGRMQHFGGFPTMGAAKDFYDTIRKEQQKLKIAKIGPLLRSASLPDVLLPKHARIVTGHAIYFLECPPFGPIKIGYSAHILKRIMDLNGSNGQETKFLGAIPGSRANERALHQRFAHAHAHHEWFWPYSDLLQFLVSLGMEPTVIMDKMLARKMKHAAESTEGWMRQYKELIPNMRSAQE